MSENAQSYYDMELPDCSQIDEFMLEKICSSLRDQHEYLNETLAGYRSTATMLVGFCAPTSAALLLYGVQAELICIRQASLWMAAALMFAAVFAALGMWMVKWGTHGQMPRNWFYNDQGKELTPAQVADYKRRVISFVYGSAEQARLNEIAMKKVGFRAKIAIIIATIAPLVGLIALLISAYLAAP